MGVKQPRLSGTRVWRVFGGSVMLVGWVSAGVRRWRRRRGMNMVGFGINEICQGVGG